MHKIKTNEENPTKTMFSICILKTTKFDEISKKT